METPTGKKKLIIMVESLLGIIFICDYFLHPHPTPFQYFLHEIEILAL